MEKKWHTMQPDIESIQNIKKILKCDHIMAALLANRNIISKNNITAFFHASTSSIRKPFLLKDMDAAVKRIHTAIINNENILIFGDFDTDGITATAILVEFLRYTGASVSYYIPHRIKEGYSIQSFHISDSLIPDTINLIITVDCGSTSHDAVNAANAAGIDVIITDHHNIPDSIPEACAVINPKQNDCFTGVDDLAGVGVAFYLIISLRKHLRNMHFWQEKPEPNLKKICDLVALGTIADMVPLVEENRILARTGIEVINSSRRPGIKALCNLCGINNFSLDGEDIAFKIAPLLNASGRMAHAKEAVELLLTKDNRIAGKIAKALIDMNLKRREIEQRIFDEINNFIQRNHQILKLKALILSDKRTDNGWHPGVIGIVAARLAKQYHKPVMLIAVTNGIGKGSGRSIPGYDIHAALKNCSDLLEGFGGHSMAAGLTIKAEKLPAFHKIFEDTVRKTTKAEDLIPVISIDCELDFDDITDVLLNNIERLKPFGTANREPLFMAGNIKVASSKIAGSKHRRMLLKQQGSKTDRLINAIQFNIDINKPMQNRYDRMAFHIKWNRWNGSKTMQIIVEEM
ncbi:MAG: single-stranded-DNA-specific exonuclease RecJ [Deltaproteobacteria bacterium]|nr:single-stranded-DNA-specific exonuclease RecJ [Deltaproteobacteria bacterium]